MPSSGKWIVCISSTVHVYFTLQLQSLTSLLLLHEASDAGKRQLGNTFIKFVCWRAALLETSTQATIPHDIMMTVVTGAPSILENMHAECIRKGPRGVIICGLKVLGRIRDCKKLNIVVKMCPNLST